MAMVMSGISIFLLVLLVFVNIADYALYSTKRSVIARGIDYSVCAAIQEIDRTASESGLATGYDETTGRMSIDGIILSEAAADNAFYSTLQSNTGIRREDIQQNTLLVIGIPVITGLNYIIRKESQRFEGSVPTPTELESVINNKINLCWDGTDPLNDSHIIYIGGNPLTNSFKKVPYYMVFIKNYEIDGLFRRRSATFVDFAGAKAERVVSD